MHTVHKTTLLLVAPLLAAVSFLFFEAVVSYGSDADLTENHSFVWTGDKKHLFDDAFIKKLNDRLDTNYEDLGLVFFTSFDGAFVREAMVGSTGLEGRWSFASATDTLTRATIWRSTRQYKEIDGRQVEGLKIGTWYFHGYLPQYIKITKEYGLPGPRAKEIADAAKDDNCDEQKGEYSSSGPDADSTYLHGGTRSNHAIIFVGRIHPICRIMRLLTGELYKALLGIGYTNSTIDCCFSNEDDHPLVDRKGNDEDLNNALDDLNRALLEHPGEEKALIVISGHGGRERRKTEKEPNGEGKLYSVDHNSLSLELDSVFIEYMKEEITADDYYIRPTDSVRILITTREESVSGPIGLRLNRFYAGEITLNNSPSGSDYKFAVPIAAIEHIAPDLDTLCIEFDFASPDDFFRVATDTDFYTTPDYPWYHYGIGVCVAIVSAVVEPDITATLMPHQIKVPRGTGTLDWKCIFENTREYHIKEQWWLSVWRSSEFLTGMGPWDLDLEGNQTIEREYSLDIPDNAPLDYLNLWVFTGKYPAGDGINFFTFQVLEPGEQ